MGLDAWLYVKKRVFNGDHIEEMAYWRRHGILNAHMARLFFKQSPDAEIDAFNGGRTFLTEQDVDEIIKLIKEDEFSDDYWTSADKASDLETFNRTKEFIRNGYTVYYECSY
jgi:hypothetical protein